MANSLRNNPQSSAEGWYDRLVLGFASYSRWPLAKKWVLVGSIGAVMQLSFNLLAVASISRDPTGISRDFLALAWPWLIFMAASVPVAFLISGRGLWSEIVTLLILLVVLGFAVACGEILSGGQYSLRLYPICLCLIGVLLYGPRVGALGGLFVFCAMLGLDIARLQGWLPALAIYALDSSDTTKLVASSQYFMANVLAAEYLLVMVGLAALIFSGRDRLEAALRRTQNQIRRYIPPAVADQIIAGNEAAIAEPKRQRVTVLFSDIVGFTDMADRLDAESLAQILNEYMAAMAEIVNAQNGTLNEFAGDGLMALFGAPLALPPDEQVLNAVQAAQKMQALLPEQNRGWRKLGIGEPLKIRVGINTGVLSVGSFGSEGRMTYTAIGLQTNIASRIESQAAPGEILLSDASYQLICDQIDCEPRGEVECKGVHFPVKIYAPKAPATAA